MPAKLPSKSSGNYLRMDYQGWWYPRNPPHLLYANLDFQKPGTPQGFRRLLPYLGLDHWTEERTLRYLKKHQAEFRRCLKWIAEGTRTDFDVPEGEEEDEFSNHSLQQRWKQQAEIQFLQLHGLDHSGVDIGARSQDGTHFYGLELNQRQLPRDPLDPLCWYLLSSLMWDGTVQVQCCKYSKCGKFFRAQTARKVYCSNACRAGDFMSKKSAVWKRRRMREWRNNPQWRSPRRKKP